MRQRLDRDALAGGHGHLGERDGKTAIREVVAGGQQALAGQRPDKLAMPALGGEVDGGRSALLPAADVAQIDRLAEPSLGLAQQEDLLAGSLRRDGDAFGEIVEHADAADGRGRQDRPALGLVVERDVAGDDGEVEFAAGLADAADAADELAHDLRPLGIAEIEVVGDGQRQRADGREVAIDLGHRLLAALDRVGLAIAGRDIAGHGRPFGPFSTRMTAASPPGRCTVLPRMIESYCS